ncbi:hypothetical protein [Undibacterium umbellatum]|uniref:Uncharacterized protein n=1 Tax=Undibacterium umbellatum TaxID=2762300 RepID=A0ABR6Z9G5_9BURK|nr:hypothetical protein [Undibacterium umbellatum]MBC3908405.1 hypothetical protein [Undibacterium umbellatum]
MIANPTNDFENFIDTLVDELISMPDNQVLEGIEPNRIQADGLRLLEAAKAQAGRARLAAAKSGVSALSSVPVVASTTVTPEQARRFIVQATNDGKYTLAARSLGEMSDDEAIKLYNQLKSLEIDSNGEKI